MYWDYKIIDGILHTQSMPNGPWKAMDAAQITARLVEVEQSHQRRLLQAKQEAYEDAANVADDWEPVRNLLPLADEAANEAAHAGQHEAGERIAASIRAKAKEQHP